MILVLPPTPALVAEVRAAAEAEGWTAETSMGEEQAILTLRGEGDAEELERLLSARGDVDVVPILTADEYRRVRARRRFLTGAASGLGALTAVGLGIPLVGFLLPPRRSPVSPSIVRAAGTDELEPGQSKLIRLNGLRVLLVRTDDGRYFAVSAVCTHMDVCQLEWSAERQQLLCPCHGGAFDVHGNVVQGPPSIPLPTYAVERAGAALYVQRRG